MKSHTLLRRSAGDTAGVSADGKDPGSSRGVSAVSRVPVVSSTTPCNRAGSASSAGRKRSRSRRAASGTWSTISRGLRPAQMRAKFSSSAATRSGCGPQLVKTLMLSQFVRQPAAVSFRLPFQAMRSPVRSSTTPAFSWNMPSSLTGLPRASQGTATFTSRQPRATIQASNSRAPEASASGGARGRAAKCASTCRRNSSPRSMASISDRSRVQPTTRRMRPRFRTSPSMPSAARARAPALK